MKFLKSNLIWLMVVSLVVLSCTTKKEPTKEVAEQPNILFIFADDWGFGDLGCYGHKEVATPNVDKLASEGTRYTQFHVTSGVCSPSRTSVITGHFPARYRVHGHFAGNEMNASRGMPNYLTDSLDVYLPRMMQQAGYVTAHYGKWHLGGGGLPNGDPTAPGVKEYGYDDVRVWNGNGPTWNGDQYWPDTRYMDDDTLWVQSSSKLAVNETIKFMKKHKGEKPMFINLWLKDPHTPLWPSEEQRKPYKGLDPDKETYYSVLTDADYHIGRLMKALTEMGLDENTLVLFSSDNGPAHVPPALFVGSTGGLKGRKVDVFEGGVKVPLIVRWPGHVNAAKVDSVSVLSTVDLLPTFCELAGKSLPESYKPDGESITCIFDNEKFERSTPLFWEWRFTVVNSENPYQANRWPTSAVLKGDWKLLYNTSIGRTELYNILKDPFEKNNLAEQKTEMVSELMGLWNQWKQELPE
jgi:N-acetylgalactosamine-6-sulfatase